ncbi:MAG TPA: oligosaccharide flippase family protein [Thermoanaerobaculia bacterium]|nr:oligosaccharide flippase family protein [Thermoanaerobaculia bacterium]
MSPEQRPAWPWARGELSSWLWLGTSYGLSAVFSFAYVALAGRRLGPASAADFYSGLFAIYLIAMLVWPLGGAVSRTTAAAIALDRRSGIVSHQRRVRHTTLAGVTVIALLAAAGVPHMTRTLGLGSNAPLLVALATALFLGVLSVDRGFLRGAGDFRAFSTNQATESSLRLLCGIGAVVWWPTASATLAAYLAACAGAWLLARRQVDRLGSELAGSVSATDRHPSLPEGHDTWRWILPLLVVAVAEAGYQNLDPLVARATLDAESAGAYGAAAALARTFGILASPFVATALPDASSASARGGGVLASFGRTVTAFLLVAGLPLIACAFMPLQIVTSILGNEFSESAKLLPILALAWTAGCAALLATQALIAAGRVAFLWFFLAGLGVEAWLLLRAEPSALDLARVTLAVKGTVLLLLLGVLAHSRHRGTG